MSESKKTLKGRIRWTEAALALTTLLLAALLIAQCISAYRVGNAPDNFTSAGVRISDVYSREIVTVRLSNIAWAFWLWLAALCAAIVQRVLRPQKPQMPVPDPAARLNLLLARVQKTPTMLAEERKRRLAAVICGAVCALCAAPAALYLLNIANFTSWELESVMGAMLLNVGPWVLLAFAALFARAQVCYKSISREAEAASKAPKLAQPLPKKPINAGKGRMILRGALYVAAAALIACGIANGGMRDVLVKAINICTECIGLG